MKKIICICSVIIIFLICSAGQASIISKEFRDTTRSPNWVIMLYLNGDNALTAVQEVILDEVRLVGSTAQVKFAVLIDQNLVDDTRLYYIVGNALEQQTWPPESNMDDADTIRQFAEKVMADYSSDHYVLILSSNKGSGWQGICWDDHGDGIMITMPELLEALNEITNNGTNKLDILGIETCMTGNLEVAYQVHSCCDYFIAYPECGVTFNWPYEEPFSDLISNPSMSPEDLASCIVSYFVPQDLPQYDMKTTMAAIDLSKIDEIVVEVDELAQMFILYSDEFKEDIQTAQANTRIYAQFWDIDYYIDPYHFMELLSINNPDVNNVINEFMTLMDTAVIANAHLPDDDVHGLNFYFPRRNIDYNSSLRYDELPSPYEETLFATDTNWDEFLKIYLGIFNNTPPDIPTINGLTSGKKGEEYEYTFVSIIDPEDDNIFYYIDWGDGSFEDWFGPYEPGLDIRVKHTWNKKGTYTIKAKVKDTYGAESDWGTLEVSMPMKKIFFDRSSMAILIGKLTSLEKNQDGDFRFLPIKMLELSYNPEQGRSIKILDEMNGGYPCCGYIDSDNFCGFVTSRFICGIWHIQSLHFKYDVA